MPAPSLPSAQLTKEAAASSTKEPAAPFATPPVAQTAAQSASPAAASSTKVDAAHPANAPFVCPECGRVNSESVEFCTHCHHTLLFRCPMCWSVQRHGGTCDNCHLDLEKYWRVKSAAGRSQLINDEATSLDKSVQPAQSVLLTIASIPLRFLPFGEWLGATLLLNWLRKRFPDLP